MNRAKEHIGRTLRRSMGRYNHATQKSIAVLVRASPANISRFEKGRAQELSFNQLFRFLAILEPNFRILIAPEGAITDEMRDRDLLKEINAR